MAHIDQPGLEFSPEAQEPEQVRPEILTQAIRNLDQSSLGKLVAGETVEV